MKLLNTRQ